MISRSSCRLTAAGKPLAAALFVLLAGLTAGAQALSVLPVNIFFTPGQRAASLTVTNQGKSETAIQIRAYAWNQRDGDDHLTASNEVVASPPLATMAPGASQVVRLILRQSPKGQEATYRILLDQIPPPAEPGVVHIVLRMSIPIFAQPATRPLADVQFHLERNTGEIYLVGFNAGNLHESIRDIVLTASDGRKLKEDSSALPYILAGVTRRWHIAAQDSQPLSGETLQLTAHANAGAIDEQVRFVPAQ
jgi:fimbrial chaperone protein